MRDRNLYRSRVNAEELVPFQVTIKETDLLILAERDLRVEARELVLTYRHRLEEYIADHPDFLTALHPLEVGEEAPEIVRKMSQAASHAGVGPMAAVAGAVAELVGEGLREASPEVFVENGGDIYLSSAQERVVGIYTGEERIGTRLGIKIPPAGHPLGICTSSGRIGHSLSLGEASTATVLAPSAALADAAATAVGNLVRGMSGISDGLELAKRIPEVSGTLIVHGEQIGAWGALELVALEG